MSFFTLVRSKPPLFFQSQERSPFLGTDLCLISLKKDRSSPRLLTFGFFTESEKLSPSVMVSDEPIFLVDRSVSLRADPSRSGALVRVCGTVFIGATQLSRSPHRCFQPGKRLAREDHPTLLTK